MILYKVKTRFQKILGNYRLTAKYLELHFIWNNYLKPKGWFESKFKRMPVDKTGDPIPWFTYASIFFINQKLVGKSFSVFEFGSGNSTLFFASRVKNIVSIEYDESYFNKISEKLLEHENVTYNLATLGKDYYQQILNYKNEFEVIIIDGRERNLCAKNCLEALTDNGIIIWDNSDRKNYSEGYKFLQDNGFKKIDFMGHGPISTKEWQTSIYYRDGNCFDI